MFETTTASVTRQCISIPLSWLVIMENRETGSAFLTVSRRADYDPATLEKLEKAGVERVQYTPKS